MANSTLFSLQVLPQIFIALSMASLFSWIFFYNDQPANELFKWHPFCMGLSFFGLMAEAVVAYHTFPGGKPTQKLWHLLFNTLGLLTAIAGMVIVFRYHSINSFPDLYSLHSWVGLLTFILLGIQYIVGFAAFWWPRPKESTRRQILPFHVLLGCAVFILGAVSAVSGLLEKVTFTELTGATPVGKYSGYAMVGNLTGVLLVLSSAMALSLIYLRRTGTYPAPAEFVTLN